MEVAMADSNVSGFQQVAAENSEFNDNNSPAPHIDQDVAKPTQGQDVEKTLLEAEQFLTNFAGLREENENLKQQLQDIEVQLESVTQELRQCQLDKQSLEQVIVQEREHHKETLWSVRGELQKAQEERLSWKEKYLDACMESGSTPNNNITAPLGSQGSLSPGKRLSLLRPAKRKHEGEGSSSTATDGDQDYYANLETAFSLAEQDEQQPVVPPVNQLWDPVSKRFECKECKATFRMFSELQAHIDKQRCVKYTFQCPQCSVVFSNATSFTKHLKYHTGKTMQCEFCGDKFMNTKGLQRHVKMYHTEFNQQFPCQYCPKIFGRKVLLENHIRRHFDYRPFKCDLCDKSFKTKQYLTGHVNGVHRNDKQFICDKCDARFSWRTTWKRHMQNHLKKDAKKSTMRKKPVLPTPQLVPGPL